jgi:putative ABC transport system ATP-binding protein
MSKVFALPENKTALIDIAGVIKTYQNAAGSFTALKDINLTFFEGEFVGVIGKSGSGKSTLVNMITGIDRPTQGQVFVDGKDIHALKESTQARWRGLNLGVVFQFFQLLPMLTLLENVLLPMDFCDRYDRVDRVTRAMDLLAMVGLADVAHHLPGAVSGGQQQSAAIARALANDPPIIVADEPTGNLDAKTADSVYDKFTALADEGRTIIMITHDPEIEDRLSRKVLLSDGEVIDPLLVHAFPWLPPPNLLVLGHALVRQTFSKGQSLDLSMTLADRLVILEFGEIQLIFKKKNHKKKTVTLYPGAYFAGSGILNPQIFHDVSAKSITDSTMVATLSREALSGVLDMVPGGKREFMSRLQEKMLAWKSGRPDGKEVLQ